MEAKQETITRRSLWSGTAAGLFFLLFYLYVWLVVDPRLVHHALGILVPYAQFAFRTDGPFFLEHLARAGGLVEYGVRLLSQLYAFGWAGALIATASAWCMGALVEGVLARGGRRGGEVLRFVPAAIVLLMYCVYSHPLGPVLSIVTTVGAFAIYVRWRCGTGPARRDAPDRLHGPVPCRRLQQSAVCRPGGDRRIPGWKPNAGRRARQWSARWLCPGVRPRCTDWTSRTPTPIFSCPRLALP